MVENIFDIFFVLSVIAPIVALIVWAFALAVPTTELRRRTDDEAGAGARLNVLSSNSVKGGQRCGSCSRRS